MQSVTIGKNDAGQRLDKFITKSFPTMPGGLMYKYIRLKRIKLNGKRAQIDTRLCEGDLLELYVNDELLEKKSERYDFLSASPKIDILYEDENIALLDKKQGLLSHPDENEYNDTLITRFKRCLYERGEYDPADENSFAPALVNRIDRNTQGIVIAAKNAEALRILNEKMKNRELRKFYLCIVHGVPARESGVLEGWLVKDEKNNRVSVHSARVEGAKQARTKYNVLSTKNGYSLVEIELLTGRTHQIRAQFAAIGNPLLGDGKYGTNAMNKALGYKKQFLCSYKLVFDFREDAGILEYLRGRSFELPEIRFLREFESGSLFKK